jgi:hypothetical protein
MYKIMLPKTYGMEFVCVFTCMGTCMTVCIVVT